MYFCCLANHPRVPYRRPCNQRLLAEVVLQDGNKHYCLHKTYCYKSVIDSLRDLARHNGFLEDCEHWGDRHLAQGLLDDIYDGRVWKNVSGQPFLADPNDLVFILNID